MGYALRRGVVVAIIVAAIWLAVCLLTSSPTEREYSSSAVVTVAVKPVPAGKATTGPPLPPGVSLGPQARDGRPGAGRERTLPPPVLSLARVKVLATQARARGLEVSVPRKGTIELEATRPSKEGAERAANAAAQGIARRSSGTLVRGPRTRGRIEARVSQPASSASSSESGGKDYGAAVLTGLAVGVALAILLALVSLLEARRARSRAARQP